MTFALFVRSGMFLPVIVLGWWVAIAGVDAVCVGYPWRVAFVGDYFKLVFYLIGVGTVRRYGSAAGF